MNSSDNLQQSFTIFLSRLCGGECQGLYIFISTTFLSRLCGGEYIYKDLTGKDMGLFVDELMTDKDHRTINPSKLKNFRQIATPCNACLAIMRGASVHAGIFYNNAIIHLTDNGVQSVPPHIAEIQHGTITYYTISY